MKKTLKPGLKLSELISSIVQSVVINVNIITVTSRYRTRTAKQAKRLMCRNTNLPFVS